MDERRAGRLHRTGIPGGKALPSVARRRLNGLILLDRFFRLAENGTTVRTEVLAGLTSFLTMAYIIVVNPTILADAGMPFAGAVM